MTLEKAFYSPSDIGTLLDLSSDTIMRYIHEGRVYAVQLSERTYRIPLREVARLTGEPLAPPTVNVQPHGGPEAAAEIRRRVQQEERVPAVADR